MTPCCTLEELTIVSHLGHSDAVLYKYLQQGLDFEDAFGNVRLSQDSDGAFSEGRTRGISKKFVASDRS
ncbi:hypothetical protein TSUD_108480 [Trifolium subterraneum]|nr:hypothetical protein TSUD_108480 [Trifolium subterraneum]